MLIRTDITQETKIEQDKNEFYTCKLCQCVGGKASLVHAMKAYRKLEIQLHSFVTSPLDRVEVCG
jgi:hypothetical protein